MNSKIYTGIITALIAMLLVSLTFGLIVGKRESVATKFLNSFIDYKSMTQEKKAAYKDDFIKKGQLARTVYQYGAWISADTKLGKLNVGRWYCMPAEDYNDMLETMWNYNKKISIPIDAWENYIPLAGFIFESGICEYIDHATGEVIRLAGYTEEGFRTALYYYMYECDMQPGNEWYLPELFQGRMNRSQIDSYFRTWKHVLPFHYAYLDHLLGQYDYKWDWVETAFHFGLEKPDYWWYDKNLKCVPNKRLDGMWSTIWLPDYYQTVFEIAQGIASGNLRRISKWEKRVEEFGKWSKLNNDYLWTLKLKFRSEEKYNEMVVKVNKWQKELMDFGDLQGNLMKSMAKMNDMVLESREKKGVLSQAEIQSMKLLKHQIESNWNMIKQMSMFRPE